MENKRGKGKVQNNSRKYYTNIRVVTADYVYASTRFHAETPHSAALLRRKSASGRQKRVPSIATHRDDRYHKHPTYLIQCHFTYTHKRAAKSNKLITGGPVRGQVLMCIALICMLHCIANVLLICFNPSNAEATFFKVQ